MTVETHPKRLRLEFIKGNPFSGHPRWKPLADALRAEIAECRRLCGLMDLQKQMIEDRNPNSVREICKAIDCQLEIIQMSREDRDALVAMAPGISEVMQDPTLCEAVLAAPEDVQSVLGALADEALSLLEQIGAQAQESRRSLDAAMEDEDFRREANKRGMSIRAATPASEPTGEAHSSAQKTSATRVGKTETVTI